MQTSLFSPIAPRTVEREITSLLRDAIISGKLELGAHIPETDMAEQMQVSRIPVREALRQLEQEGLVTRKPNRGCYVITFSEQDVREVFSLRAMLESMAISWAVERMDSDNLAHLRNLIHQQETAIHNGDYDTLSDLDLRFHEYICIKANHTRLLKNWYEQHAQCQMLLNMRFHTLSDNTPETVPVDHNQILAALEEGDAPAAVELTHEISERVSGECIAMLRKRQTNQ